MSAAISLPDLGLIVRTTAQATGGQLSLIESVGMSPGDGPPRHVHTREDEAFYVIEGSYTWERGDERVDAGPGSFIWLPREVPHRFVVGPSGGRMLHLFIPGGIDRYFVEWQEHIASNDAPGIITALAARYGLSYTTDQR